MKIVFVWDYRKTVYFCTEFVCEQFQLLKSCCPLKDLIFCNHSLLPCYSFRRYMAPKWEFFSHTTPSIMSSSTNSAHDIISSDTSTFDQFHWVSVGMSGQTIRVPIVLPMREAPYRNTLINHHFFNKIKYLTVNDTFSHGDLVSTVSSYFEFETVSVEIQSDTTVLIFSTSLLLRR